MHRPFLYWVKFHCYPLYRNPGGSANLYQDDGVWKTPVQGIKPRIFDCTAYSLVNVVIRDFNKNFRKCVNIIIFNLWDSMKCIVH